MPLAFLAMHEKPKGMKIVFNIIMASFVVARLHPGLNIIL